ncbi:MAG: ATP-binding protein [Succinivibrionaceae bacterium]|nr:ATP-binding protein [Succinivibrionaceae bacterium]
MLLEFSCSNHKSIRNDVSFSAVAGPSRILENKTLSFGSYRLLRSSVIYGPEGSGKSNFTDAILFMRALVLNSADFSAEDRIRQTTNRLEPAGSESSYIMHFDFHDRFIYGFTLKDSLVKEEYLHYFRDGIETMVFERGEDGFSMERGFVRKMNAFMKTVKPNQLLLSCAARNSDFYQMRSPYSFFASGLAVCRLDSDNMNSIYLNYSLYQISSSVRAKSLMLKVLKELGTGVKDIEVTIDRNKLGSGKTSSLSGSEFANMLMQKGSLNAKIVYKRRVTDLLRDESEDFRKIFYLFGMVSEMMAGDMVVVCDDLEMGEYFSAVKAFISAISELDVYSGAQLIFTTKDARLLDHDFFRKDQIWFAERKRDNSTDLYPVTQLKNARRREGYISGKHGDIPMPNDDFAEYLAQL